MSTPVTIIVPSLDELRLLDRGLPPLFEELRRRAAGDEVLVVDDSGEGKLAEWLTRRFPAEAGAGGLLRTLVHEENRGFARALETGVEHARHPLVFAMNSDLTVRPGFLEPLIEALDDPQVFAAVPRVLRAGEAGQIESLVTVELVDEPGLERGRVRVRQPALEDPPGGSLLPDDDRPRPVAFALGGACLLRRAEFQELGGFDPLFSPFYMEDVDLCWRAWRGGRRCLLVPRSTVEHENQATIRRVASPELREAAIECNQLLFAWKHLDRADDRRAHVEALEQRVFEAALWEDRRALVHLALALEHADLALASGAALPPATRSFREILTASEAE